ncbi:hypothetical protein MTQ01_11710 [Streptomyces sp. XM4193]|uniref:hypothetical protein n=1 Tax=Streptomyces sp. XM4193 TaxID=2929782 RepID=UPI001FF86C96|nr:hypothetical protein [Streptomyces sp. XM4193]MCK1796669.1 hypothetical protein [Streptomyces sp. XM4193]
MTGVEPVSPSGRPPSPCPECARWRAERARARAAGDRTRASDCVVLLRRHQAAVHLRVVGR